MIEINPDFDTTHPSKENLAIVQGAVQDAIRNRNLSFVVSFVRKDSSARVDRFTTYHQEPAIALLWAYVQYLENEESES